MKILYAILILDMALLWWANGDTNIVAGVQIRTRPVIYITMAPNTTNTLWHRSTLTNEWRKVFFLHDYVVGTNSQRMITESSEWDENTDTGFFWLQVNGQPFLTTNAPESAASDGMGLPPIPTGEE